MNLLKRFLNFILFGNLFVAIGASCLIISTEIQINKTFYLSEYALLVFFATLFIYNLQRIFYKPQADNCRTSIRREWVFENQNSIKILSSIGFVGVIITFILNDFRVVYYLSPLLIVSLAYFIPFIQLRKFIWLKLLTLASVWTFVTAIIPILMDSLHHSFQELYFHVFSRFCFMVAICIPFDIRDMEIDQNENIQTLPQKFGVHKTRLIALGFIFMYLAFIGLEFLQNMISLKIILSLLLSGIATALLIYLSTPERKEYFFLLGIDGTMVLQGVLLILATVF